MTAHRIEVYDGGVFVVAIHATNPGDSSQVQALAGALGCTAYEARGRLITRGPTVVAQGPARAPLEPVARALKSAGFRVLLMDSEVLERPGLWWEVRSFELAPAGWRVTTRDGSQTAMKWDQVRLLVQGQSLTEAVTTEVVHGKRFSAARAVATGGMIRKKRTSTETTSTETTLEGYLHVFGPGTVAVVRETAVDYGGLAGAMEVSSSANFAALVATLRQRASGAVFDDRLTKQVAQAQILGSMLDPQRYPTMASALIAAAAAQQRP